MARSIWKGHISFGLVNIPVALFSAEKPKELSFKMLDSRDHSHIKYQRINESTGEEVPWDEIVKAYEYEDNNFVMLGDEDFRRAAAEQTQTIDIEDFVDEAEIDSVYYDKPYYLAPGKKGEKGYALLRETLKRTGKVGIAKVVIRTRQYLAAVIPMGNALVLNVMRFAQELRDTRDLELPDEDIKEMKVSEKELDMAEKLVEAMVSEWKPKKYHDEYTDSLLKWIEKKAKSGKVEPAKEAPEEDEDKAESANIVDMMSLLKKSVEGRGRAKARKPAAVKTAHRPARKPAAKTTRAKTAKRTTATAKKTRQSA